MRRDQKPVELATLLDEATLLGYKVEFVERIECADAPGFPGSRAGVCIPRTETIRILESLTLADKIAVLEHELDHAREPTREAAERIDAAKPLLEVEREALRNDRKMMANYLTRVLTEGL